MKHQTTRLVTDHRDQAISTVTCERAGSVDTVSVKSTAWSGQWSSTKPVAATQPLAISTQANNPYIRDYT